MENTPDNVIATDVTLVGIRYARLVVDQYADGNPALFGYIHPAEAERLDMLPEEAEHYPEVLSVNLSSAPAPGCVFVRDYSENAGLANDMVQQGVATIERAVRIGMGTGFEVRLTARRSATEV